MPVSNYYTVSDFERYFNTNTDYWPLKWFR